MINLHGVLMGLLSGLVLIYVYFCQKNELRDRYFLEKNCVPIILVALMNIGILCAYKKLFGITSTINNIPSIENIVWILVSLYAIVACIGFEKKSFYDASDIMADVVPYSLFSCLIINWCCNILWVQIIIVINSFFVFYFILIPMKKIFNDTYSNTGIKTVLFFSMLLCFLKGVISIHSPYIN